MMPLPWWFLDRKQLLYRSELTVFDAIQPVSYFQFHQNTHKR